VSACFAISSISAILSSVIVISIWFKVSQPEPTPKFDGDRQHHHRPRAALRRGLRARPLTPTVGTLPLRHGFGINATVNGVPLHMVQKWMGHAQLSTTAIYADAVGKEEQDIAARMWG